jgi:transglutaminase-like putative cysteine protease
MNSPSSPQSAKRFLPALIVFFVLITIPGASAQNRYPLEEMQQKYPGNDVIVYNSDVRYSIEIDYRGIEYCRVKETNSTTFLALKDHTQAVDVRFYDQYSEITKNHVTGTGFFKPYASLRCGDFEEDGVFYHDARVCQFVLRFDKAGEHLTVTTEKVYTDIRYFTRIMLATPYATRRKTVRIEIPEGADVQILENNFDAYVINRDTIDPGSSQIKATVEYSLYDFPASQRLEDLPDSRCFSPHLTILFSGYTVKDIYTPVLHNLDDLYTWYYSLVSQNGIADEELTLVAAKLTAGTETDSARLAAIYYWVQDKIRYVAFENGPAAFTPDSPQNVYKKRFGDCKGMANLCKTLLSYVGFDARLCWVYGGTDCAHATIPSISTHNHMICAVMLHDSILYLDPTRNYSSLTEINEGIQGKTCIIENGDTYLLKEIPPTPTTSNLMKITNAITLLDNELKVAGSITLTGSFKKDFQYYLNHLPVEYKDKLVNYFVTGTDNNYIPDHLTTSPPDSMCRQFDISYTMTVKNKVLDLGDELLLSLNFYRFLQNESIDTKRPLPYKTGTRETFREVFSLIIPEGMTLAALPSDVEVKNPKYEFRLSYHVADAELLCQKEVLIKDPVLTVSEIADWNAAIAKLNEFYKEMIILKH